MNKEEYIERTTKIMHQLDTGRLKKVYTVAKTLFEISKGKRKGGVEHGEAKRAGELCNGTFE